MSSNELFEKVNKILEKVPEERSSYYQLKHFTLGKEPTTQGQLWRCLKEIQMGKETIDAITLQLEDLRDDIAIMELQDKKLRQATASDEEVIQLRKIKRKKESLLANIDKLEKASKYKTQEVRFFVQAFESLNKVEKVKDYDDFDAQQEYWEAKISEEINLRILMHQPINIDLIRMALSLPDECRTKTQILQVIENNKANLLLELKKENDV